MNLPGKLAIIYKSPWSLYLVEKSSDDLTKIGHFSLITVTAPIDRHSWLERYLEYNATF